MQTGIRWCLSQTTITAVMGSRLAGTPMRLAGRKPCAARWRTVIILSRNASQRRARIFPALKDDGSIEFAEQLVDLDPLLFNGKVGSAFTRLSSTELANVSSGGGMVPTFMISEKK